MITVYKRLEGNARIVFYAFCILYGLILFVINIMELEVASGEMWKKILKSVFPLSQTFFIICFVIATVPGSKVQVDDTLGEIVLGNKFTTFGITKISIGDITTIEVIKNRKNKIKRLLIRCGPVKFHRIEPARAQECLAHLLKLNPNIDVLEKIALGGI